MKIRSGPATVTGDLPDMLSLREGGHCDSRGLREGVGGNR